jgi:hypothetical protein
MSRMSWRVMLVMGAMSASVAFAASEKKEEEGKIDPKANEVLKKMGTYLSGLKTFRVESETADEKVTTDGQKIQELKTSTITVQRPGNLRVDRVGSMGKSTLRTDGKQASLYNQDKNVYALGQAPGTLDKVVDELREKFMIDAPGGDFLGSKPYDDLVDGLMTGHYIGLERIDGQMAHHIAVTEKDVDWQIWIADGEQAVPLRYVITSKDMPSQPEFTIRMSNWEPNVQITPDMFKFTPPAGAKKIDFMPPKPTN